MPFDCDISAKKKMKKMENSIKNTFDKSHASNENESEEIKNKSFFPIRETTTENNWNLN